jgi:hypothetical protein
VVKAGDPDTIDLCDSAVRLIFRQLPDLGDDVLRLIVDSSKPNAMAHVLLMVNEACDEPIPLDELARRSLPGPN